MSGPMAAGFGLEAGVIVAAEAIAQGMAEIAAGMTAAEREAEELRRRRREERRRQREALSAGAQERQRQADRGAAQARLAGLLDGLAAGAPEIIERVRALAEAGESLQAQLEDFLEHARRAEAGDLHAARRALVARVLERLEIDADAPLPPALEALAREIVAAPTPARADALATELRLQVQQWNAARDAAAEQRRREAAAAVVLEQSLKDLGYAVEDIEETLFVTGGVAHFQKPGWDDYFVRLRIDPRRGAMNFNVVRAGAAGADRRREDMLAEERWCSEFPKLFETLGARGMPITVTRLLQAGEAPVQVVDAATLPARTEEERRHATPQARSLP